MAQSGDAREVVRQYLSQAGMSSEELETALANAFRLHDSVATWSQVRRAIFDVFAMTMIVSLFISFMALSSGASDHSMIRFDLVENRLREIGIANRLVLGVVISALIGILHSLLFFAAIMILPRYDRWCGFGILLTIVSALFCAIIF